MSQYAVFWNDKTKTFTLKDEEGGNAKKDALTHLYFPALGEVPRPSYPKPFQVLENLALSMGIAFKYVTIKNETNNDRLDAIEHEGEKFVEHPNAVIYSGNTDEPVQVPDETAEEADARAKANKKADKEAKDAKKAADAKAADEKAAKDKADAEAAEQAQTPAAEQLQKAEENSTRSYVDLKEEGGTDQ